jgi:hypothetical protein
MWFCYCGAVADRFCGRSILDRLQDFASMHNAARSCRGGEMPVQSSYLRAGATALESWYSHRKGQARGAPISGSCAMSPITVWCHCTVAPQPGHPPEKCKRELSRTGLPASSASTKAPQFSQLADIKNGPVCLRSKRGWESMSKMLQEYEHRRP